MTKMELVESRHSVRQYLDKAIEADKRAILDELCKDLDAKSGLSFQLFYDEPKCFNSIMAHYGSFKGVSNYLAIVGPKNGDCDEAVGYFGEEFVLKAQELGLNTCWVAMTHGKSKAVIPSGQKLYIIISLGYGATQGKPHNSKPESVLANVSEDSPEWYKEGVKAAILAPTAVNQQKFFVEQAGEEAKITVLRAAMAKMDLGIVKYNFEYVTGHKTI